MKTKSSLFLLLFLSVIVNAAILVAASDKEFSYVDRMNEGTAIFFIFDMEENERIEIWLKPDGKGDFGIFLFDEKPEKDYITQDRELSSKIYDKAILYDLHGNLYINFTADKNQIYYIEIVLLENGPDIFTLESTKKLTRYFIPAMPGFPLEVLLLTIIAGIIIIIRSQKSKRI